MAVALLAQTAFTVLFAVVFGGMGIFYLFAQSFIAISLVENANYVVHYGLPRKEIAQGKYEPVRPRHSCPVHGCGRKLCFAWPASELELFNDYRPPAIALQPKKQRNPQKHRVNRAARPGPDYSAAKH